VNIVSCFDFKFSMKKHIFGAQAHHPGIEHRALLYNKSAAVASRSVQA